MEAKLAPTMLTTRHLASHRNFHQYRRPALHEACLFPQSFSLTSPAELNTTITLQSLESASFDPTTFEILKGELIAEIMGGMSIRAFNQAVAPPGNPALSGLATYASAQSAELGLAESLTGVPDHDLPILSTIHSDVVAGTQLNEYNLGNATEGCSLGSDLTSY